MAQYKVETGTLDPKISSHYEVVMLANNANGDLISRSNPLPVSLGADTITITGNTFIVDTVNVASSPENPVHNHITEVGTGGLLTVPYLPIGGNVNVTNIITVTGNVTVNGTINIGNTVQVNVINFPATQNVSATINGTVTTVPGGASSTTAFGEPLGITITPVIQLDSIYGTTTEVIQLYNNGTGSSAGANANTAMWEVNSGTDVGGYGVLRSKRFLRYRPGQGALCRLTAAFTTPANNSTQRAGLFNQENAIMVGYNGTNFGVMRATGGKAYITVLTINTAPNATQNITITLNGVAFTFPIGANTATAAAAEISIHGGFTGWLVEQVDNTVVFLADSLGAKNGTYSLTSTGNITGTFSTKQLGVAQTENWTYQNDFNVDKLNGSGPSGMTIHPENLNVYQINFRWLGAGEIRYAIEDQVTGNMIFFHREHYTNQYSLPHISQPSFKIGYVVYSLGNTTNLKVTGASMMGAIEGDIRQNELNRSTSTSATTLAQNTLHHLFTLRNPYVTNGKAGALNGNYILNAKEILLKDISIATQGNDPGIVYIFFEPTSFTGVHQYASQPKDNGMISTTSGTIDETIDTAVCRFITAINGESQYKLSDFRIAVPPGSNVSIAIKSTSQISRVSVAMVFSED